MPDRPILRVVHNTDDAELRQPDEVEADLVVLNLLDTLHHNGWADAEGLGQPVAEWREKYPYAYGDLLHAALALADALASLWPDQSVVDAGIVEERKRLEAAAVCWP